MRLHHAVVMGMACLVVQGCDDDGMTDAMPDAMSDAMSGAMSDAMPEPRPDAAPDLGADPEPDGGGSAEAIAALEADVDRASYTTALSVIGAAPRASALSENWQRAQDLCADTFLAAGLEVTRQPLVDDGVNVVGVLPGTTRPEEHVVLGASYDSRLRCDSADGNGSGAAGLLEAVRVLGARRYERTLVFICFDGSAIRERGARDYVARARDRGDDIRGMVSLQNIAFTDDRPDSQVVPAGLDLLFPDAVAAVEARERRGDFLFHATDADSPLSEALEAAAAVSDLPFIGVGLQEVFRTSDLAAVLRASPHGVFWDAGYPATMLTDTGTLRNPRFACRLGEDDLDSLDIDFAIGVTRIAVGAVARMAVPAEGEPTQGREVEPEPVRQPMYACDGPGGTCEDGQRCALDIGENAGLVCEPPPEMPLALDAPCEQREDGSDSCAPGLICTAYGFLPDQQPVCRPICHRSADCADGEVCPSVNLEGSNCMPTCDPFGDDCGEGRRCVDVSAEDGRGRVMVCLRAGPVGEGGACDAERCLSGLTCTSQYTRGAVPLCHAWCRPSAPDCGDAMVCRQLPSFGIPDDTGVCVSADLIAD